MTLFDARFRKCAAYLADEGQRVWGARFLGRRLDRRWAGGSEFVGHADYASGDDFRAVDWQLCARTDELRTRQYRGSEDRVVDVLVDCSAGMQLGAPVKFDVARQLAGVLAAMALSGLDRVGLAGVTDRVLVERRAARGRSQLPGLLRFLDGLSIQPEGVDLRAAVDAFVRRRPHRGLLILISDFFDPAGFEGAVDRLVARGFQPYLLQVIDGGEAEPVLSGPVQLYDVGRGNSRSVVLDGADLRHYRQVWQEFHAGCLRFCARRGIGWHQTRTAVPIEQAVLAMIRTATRRMRAGWR